MAETILIDTNVFVDYLRNHPPSISFIESLQGKSILFSAITETELLAGSDNNVPEVRSKLLQMLFTLAKVDVSNPAALLAGDLCRKYHMSIPDAIIAATCIQVGATLITKNKKDFESIRELSLKVPY